MNRKITKGGSHANKIDDFYVRDEHHSRGKHNHGQIHEHVTKQTQIREHVKSTKTFNITNTDMFRSLFDIVSLRYKVNGALAIKFMDYMFKDEKPPSIQSVIDNSKGIEYKKDRYATVTKQMTDFETKEKIEFRWIIDKETGASTDMYPSNALTEDIMNQYLKVLTYIEEKMRDEATL